MRSKIMLIKRERIMHHLDRLHSIQILYSCRIGCRIRHNHIKVFHTMSINSCPYSIFIGNILHIRKKRLSREIYRTQIKAYNTIFRMFLHFTLRILHPTSRSTS